MKKQHLKTPFWSTKVFIKLSVAVLLCHPEMSLAQQATQVNSSGFVSVPDEAEKATADADTKQVVAKADPQFSPQTDEEKGLSLEEQLRKAWQEELIAIQKKDDAEFKSVKLREEYTQKRAEFEKEIAIKKRKIYEHKSKQDQYLEEIDQMKAEIADIDGRTGEIEKDLQSAEERAKIHESKYSEMKATLDGTKGNLKASLEKMRTTRELTAKKINQYMIDMQRVRAEIATTEADISRADNDRVRAETEELQVRSEWSTLTSRAQALREDKARIYAELNDMKNRLEAAKNEYAAAKAKWAKAEQEKSIADQDATRTKTDIATQMRRLEAETAYAVNQKSIADAEKIRLSAEVEKLKTDLAFVKKRNEDAKVETEEAQGSVMESRLAFETAKADLVTELASNETAKLKNDAQAVKLRSLASVAEDSDMSSGIMKPWIVTKNCSLSRNPASSSEKTGKLKVGERLIASPAGSGYVKILNASGGVVFVPMTCGYFAE